MRSAEDVPCVSDVSTPTLMYYNFVAQDVFTIDGTEAVPLCTARDKLLVASSKSYVEVRDLDANGQLSFTFPTVGKVSAIEHCERGNYILTLEDGHEGSVVRIYLNWWVSVSKQLINVRAVGTIPQDTAPSNSIQILEFSGTRTAKCIACCGKSGTVCMAVSDAVEIFCPKILTDEQGKSYQDFYLLVTLKLSAVPQRIFLIEDHFAYHTSAELHVVKLCFESDEFSMGAPAEEPGLHAQPENIFDNVDCSSVINDTHFVEWTFPGSENSSLNDADDVEDKLKGVLHDASFPPTLTLRSESFRAIIGLSGVSEKIILGPKRLTNDLKVSATLNHDATEPSLAVSNIAVITVLYRRFSMSSGDSNTVQSFCWVPYYSKADRDNSSDPLTEAMSEHELALSSPLRSLYQESLKSLCCFVSSNDEGFLYDISASTTLLSTYKYTSAPKAISLDGCFLHVFTKAGLETYVLHTPASVLPSALPRTDRQATLVGLRPFLGVSTLVASDNHLVLLSLAEGSESVEQASTVYSLLKPTVCQFCTDLREATHVHENEEGMTKFVDMLISAFVVISTSILLRGRLSCGSDVVKTRSDLCFLLGDLHIKQESQQRRNEAAAYYILSEQPPEIVLSRMLSFKGKLSSLHLTKSVIAYLKLEMCSVTPKEEFTADVVLENVADDVLEMVVEECPELLHKLVLCSKTSIFRTEKCVHILQKRLTSKKQSPIYAANALAISFLLHKAGNEDAAQSMLKTLQKENLVLVLLELHDIIHRDQDITDVGHLVKSARPDAYLAALVHLKFNGKLSAEHAIFLLKHTSKEEDLHHVPLLKEYLEAILSSKKTNVTTCSHLLTMLIKIYIGRMTPDDKSPQHSPSSIQSKPAFLFGSRAPWIKELPPFNGNSVAKSCSLYATSVNLSECCLCWNCWDDLLRLQSLLGSPLPTAAVKASALEMLTDADLLDSENCVSLKVLCLPPVDAMSILVDDYPSAVIGFMQDKFADDKNQWLQLYKVVEDRSETKMYAKVVHGVLSHLSTVLSPRELVELLPCGKEEYTEYVVRCTECYQAKILRDKIICLGTELKQMM